MKLFFTWKGTRSDAMHILYNERTPIIRPEERVNHITIPGRAGELTQVEGENIFNSYIQTKTITVEGKENVQAAETWLKGSGAVSFDCQPELQQQARVINAVTFQRHSKNANFYTGEVQFYCEPIKRLRAEEDITVTASGTALDNPGTLPAFPEIRIEGSGAVSVSIGGKTMIIPECVSGWTADSENQWILENGVPQMNAWRGEFPQIPTGESTILFTGNITKLTITPRWRYL